MRLTRRGRVIVWMLAVVLAGLAELAGQQWADVLTKGR